MSTQPRDMDGTAGDADWTRSPERSNKLMLRMMTWIALRLGRRVARLVLYGIAAYFLLLAPSSRAASRVYLTRVLGRPARWHEMYRHFFCFGATILDRVYLLNQRFELFDIDVVNGEQVRELMLSGGGLFLLGAHLGSFEVIRAIGRQLPGMRVAMAMYEENARQINGMLSAINPAAQQDVIGLGAVDSMLRISAALDEGTVVGMLADRTLSNDTRHPVELLGKQAGLPLGPFRMAAIMRRPVFFMTGLYLGGNRYEIHFEPLADFSQVPASQRQQAMSEAMARYGVLLERYCRRAPYNWFNFFDFWRATPAEKTPQKKG